LNIDLKLLKRVINQLKCRFFNQNAPLVAIARMEITPGKKASIDDCFSRINQDFTPNHKAIVAHVRWWIALENGWMIGFAGYWNIAGTAEGQ
jgi:hypothetical protein